MTLKKIISIMLGGVLVFCLSVSAVLAAEFRFAGNGGNVSVLEDEVVKNLYTAGNMISIDGDIAKSLYVAGNIISINGNVEDNVSVGGGTVVLRGRVGGSVHAGAGNILIEGQIADDLFIGGGNITISPTASIGEDLIIGGGMVTIEGSIGGNIKIGAGQLVVNGKIMGDIEGEVGEMKIGEKAVIGGNLTYKGPKEAEIDDKAVIIGEVDYEKKVAKLGVGKGPSKLYGLLTIAFLIKILISIVVGLVLVYFFAKITEKIVQDSLSKFWLSIAHGFSALILTPVAIVILLITVFGICLAGILGVAYMLVMMLTAALAPIVLGSWMFKVAKKEDKYETNWKTVVVGVIVANVVMLIPFIGWLVGFVFMLISLGALYRLIFHSMISKKA